MKNLIITLIVTGFHLMGFSQTNAIADTGNVGIGTTSPNALLHLFKENTVSRTSVMDLLYLSSTHASVGYTGFGTGIVDFRRTYQNATPHAINRISFIEMGNSVYDFGGAITFETKALSSGSVAPLERMRVNYNGNVGIGTVTPNDKLEVAGGIRFGTATFDAGVGKLYTTPTIGTVLTGNTGSTYDMYIATGAGNYALVNPTGTNNVLLAEGGNVGIGTSSPMAQLSNTNSTGGMSGTNTTGIAWKSTANDYAALLWGAPVSGASYGLRINTTGATSADYPLYISSGATGTNGLMVVRGNGNIGIGTTTPSEKLTVNGTILTKKVKVTQTGWADFVFNKGYKLRRLESVEAFIKKYKRLPDVPSEREIKKKGLDVGETQALLLQKIEELTLYLIEQNKNYKEQQRLLEGQQEEIKKLQKIIVQLQKS